MHEDPNQMSPHRSDSPSHPAVAATLLMVGVALLLVAIAVAGVVT